MKFMKRDTFQGSESLAEVMAKADLNFNVVKKPVQVCGGKKIPDRFALVREDNMEFLGFCANKYKPAQNQEQMQFFDTFAKIGKTHGITNAFSFDNGAIVGAQAPLRTFEVMPGDEVQSYVTFITFHNGKGASSFNLTNTRAVCMNTVMAILSDADKFTHKHGREFTGDVVKEIEKYFDKIIAESYNFQESAKFLAAKQLSEKQIQGFFAGLYQKDIKDIANESEYNMNMKRVFEAFEDQPGASMGRGSAWQALNAVTYYTDHVQGREDSRGKVSLVGTGNTLKTLAFKNIMNLAKAA